MKKYIFLLMILCFVPHVNAADAASSSPSNSEAVFAEDDREDRKRKRDDAGDLSNKRQRGARGAAGQDVVILKSGDGAEIMVPRTVAQMFAPIKTLVGLPGVSYEESSEPIQLNEFNRDDLDILGQLMMVGAPLQDAINQEKDNAEKARKEKEMIEVLSNIQFDMLPANIDELNVMHRPQGMSPEIFAAIRKIGLQEMLASMLPQNVQIQLNPNALDEAYIALFSKFGASNIDDIFKKAIALKWLKYIEETSTGYKEKIKRYNEAIGRKGEAFKFFVESYTRPLKEAIFGVSIRDLIERGEVPGVINGALDLSGRNIGSLDGLHQIPNIGAVRGLWLGNNRIVDVGGAFAGLTSLQRLGLGNNRIGDISGAFAGLTSLRVLGLSNNRIVDVGGAFAGLTSLQKLGLNNNRIVDIGGAFTGLTSLQILGLNNNRIVDVGGAFAGLTSLRELGLHNNRIVDIGGAFADLTSLQILALSNNRIVDVGGAFAGLTSLQRLGLYNNRIVDVGGAFADLTSLRDLWLSNNRIVDVGGAFTGLTSLRELGLQNSRIVDIGGAFAGLTQLQKLWLNSHQIPQKQIEVLQAERPDLRIEYE